MSVFKSGICIDCPPHKGIQLLYSKDRCNNHYWFNIQQLALQKKIAKKSLVNQNPNQDLNKWFQYHIEHGLMVCENCGETLIYFDQNTAYSCQAHILPKYLFPSIKTNIHNQLTLGGLIQKCCCHGQYDSCWKNAESMPVFETAKKRFLLFKKNIAEPELMLLPETFLKLL